MTRARSVLAVFGQRNASGHRAQIMPVFKECCDLLIEGDDTTFVPVDDLVEICGEANRGWLEGIGRKHKIAQEPFSSETGEILFEPIFWFETPLGKYTCFGLEPPSRNDRHSAEDQGFRILMPGEAYEEKGSRKFIMLSNPSIPPPPSRKATWPPKTPRSSTRRRQGCGDGSKEEPRPLRHKG